MESVKWSQSVLAPALVQIYEDAGLSLEGVIVTKLALFTTPQLQVNFKVELVGNFFIYMILLFFFYLT